MRLNRRRTALATALLLLATVVGVGAPAAEAADAVPQTWREVNASNKVCANVLFIGVRGSGETINDGAGYGRYVAAFRQGFKAGLDPLATVHSIAIDYPAKPVGALITDLTNGTDEYFGGLTAGVSALSDVLNSSIQNCPNEQIVIAGYSQGAAVVHRALNYFDYPEKIHSVLLIADPDRNASAPSGKPYGTPSRSLGMLQAIGSGAAPLSAALRAKTIEYCRTYDPVCGLSNAVIPNSGLPAALAWLGVNTPQHTAYDESGFFERGWGVADQVEKRIQASPKFTYTSLLVGGTVSAWVAWNGPSYPLAYQWYRDGVPIVGATAAKYKLQWEDTGAITVTILGPKNGGRVHTSSSGEIYAELLPKPTIVGTPAVGSQLTAKTGSWSPAPYVYEYHWQTPDGIDLDATWDASQKNMVMPAYVRGKMVMVCTRVVTSDPYDFPYRCSDLVGPVQ